MARIALLAAAVLALAPAAAAQTVLVSARTGAVERRLPDLEVEAAVSDGHGGWYLAGTAGLTHLRHDGSVDPRRRAQAVGLHLLVRSGATLYAAADDRVAAFAADGRRVWTSARLRPPPGFGGRAVLGLAVGDGRVYAAGPFPRGVVALDARTGRLLPWRPPAPGRDAYYDAVAASGRRVYVGGPFGAVGGVPRPGLAALDAGSGALLPWRPQGAGDVERILVHRGEILTAGHDGFGVTDERSGRLVPWMRRIGGVASAFGAAGDVVYLGGDVRNTLRSVDGKPRNNLAAFDLATGRFTSWAPDLARYVSAGVIAPSGGTVLVAGSFLASLG